MRRRIPLARALAASAVTTALATGALSVTAGPALAFLSSAPDPAINDLSVGLNTVEVDEEFDPEPDEGGKVAKTVRAKNTGDCPCYVRAYVLPAVSSDFASIDWGGSPWSDPDGDGYRYYGDVLEPGAETQPLLTAIHMTDGALERDGGSPEALVYVESVQSEGFEDGVQAFAALAGEDL